MVHVKNNLILFTIIQISINTNFKNCISISYSYTMNACLVKLETMYD